MMLKTTFPTSLALLLSLLSGSCDAKIITDVEFGLLTIAPNTTAHLHGLSIGVDRRLLFVAQSRDPFVGKFLPDGRITVPNHVNGFLTIGGVNTTSMEVHEDLSVKTTFDVNSEGRLVYNGSSKFVAVNEGAGSPGGYLFRYYVYDPNVNYYNGRENLTVELRVLWSEPQLRRLRESGAGGGPRGSTILQASNADDIAAGSFPFNLTNSANSTNSTMKSNSSYMGLNASHEGPIEFQSNGGPGNLVDSISTAFAFSAAIVAAGSLFL